MHISHRYVTTMSIPALPLLELRRYSSGVMSHQHDFHQLVLPVDGALAMTIDAIEGEVAQARAAVVRAGSDHEFSGSQNNCFVVADIPQSMVFGWEDLPVYLELDATLNSYVSFMSQQLSDHGNRGSRQMLLLLLQLLQQRFGDVRPPDRRVEAGRRFIEQNFNRDIGLGEVAQAANLSSRQLTHLFRRHFGSSPKQYQLDLRMQHAQQLLKTTDWSLLQVAQLSGYSNVSAFCCRFKRYFVQAPGYYRRNSK